MKPIFVGILLALPLAFTSLSSQASAAEVIVRPTAHRPIVVARSHWKTVYVKGHWETIRGRRHWVPARTVRVRVRG
ncbi:hypothetical protein WKK05_26555 [Nostoc sp. UHCC 0302]|uniref:hypothetical protein n=1 Tax=Nostoc sp. UHCC 0302 TaxID=3134896 RepID=UPI00311CDE33